MKKVVIIGTGPAGLSTAKTLRENGYTDEITMFSAENVPPYSPATLGEYLLNENEDILYWYGQEVGKQLKLNCCYGEKIVAISPQTKKIHTSLDRIVDYDDLVIASGSSLYIPPTVKGSTKKGITNFKDIAGAKKIKETAQKGGSSAIIVGGGFIGVEIALCLLKIGIKPTILNRRSWLMPRLLDQETATYVTEELQRQGVNILFGTEGREFYGENHVEGLKTKDGQDLKADLFIAATGVKPNIDFVLESGIENDGWGIEVNDRLQTNYHNIYACGDVAKTVDFISGKAKIHGLHPVAVSHGQTVALNILGQNRAYERQVSMNSLKKLSFPLIVVGELEGEEIRYQAKNVLRKLYVKNNQLIGFVLLGDITNAGYFLSILKKRKNIKSMKFYLLDPKYSMARVLTRYK